MNFVPPLRQRLRHVARVRSDATVAGNSRVSRRVVSDFHSSWRPSPGL